MKIFKKKSFKERREAEKRKAKRKKFFAKLRLIKRLVVHFRIKKLNRLKSYIGKSIVYSNRSEKKLKKIALTLHRFHGSQYHVIPIIKNKKQMVTIINNIWLKNYNKEVKKHQRINYNQMLQSAYFSTNSQRLIK